MGAGWVGGLGAGWQGAGWQGAGWAGGGGSEGTYAMRFDRPLVADDLTPDFNGNPKFPAHGWDSDLFSLTFLPDFFTAQVAGQTWDQYITINPNIPNVIMPGGVAAPGDDSIDDLRILAVTERPEAMGEILNQAQNQQLCFMQLLTMTENSHRSTFFLMKIAARVGEVVMMRLKRHFNRPRPTQYYPALYPPLPVPGHSSYPAGHAVIAHLTARVLIEATTNGGTSPYEKSLIALAEEISLNRVIAGFHFRSDIKEGRVAGEKTHQFLTGIPPRNVTAPDFDYTSVLAAAKTEWY
jgi:acid phosphatase (class A)